ncbi:ABC transporter ATP-binding protein [Rhodococcus aerolatus]
MTDLRVRGLTVELGGARVLDGVDLDVAAGSWTTVVGPNGSGKSTLLRAVLGLLPADGEVRVGGQAVRSLGRRAQARLLALVPQRPVLPEDTTVTDYVALGRTPHLGVLAAPGAVDRAEVARALARLDLDALAGRRLGTLSGGEAQRAVVARALAQRAQVLLLDEPTAALDLGHAQQVLELVDRLRVEDGLTVVATLHDLSLAGQYADRLVALAHGRVVARGTPREVLTAELLAEHHGARATVLDTPDGLVVAPRRPRADPPRARR